jgi:hypothetical protein
MNIAFKNLSAAVVTLAALVGSASAQLQTFETQSAYRGSVITFIPGDTRGEIFSNVSAVKSMTYNFFVGAGASGVSISSNFEATFGEWDSTNEAFVAGTTVAFSTINVPASDSGNWTTLTNGSGSYSTFAQAFDLSTLSSELISPTFGYLTSSSKSYAMMLTLNGSVAPNLGLGQSNNNAFAFGISSDNPLRDWTFSQIVVAPGDQQLVPVPESSTVALAATGALVAGLVGFRVRQRRRAAAAMPVAA